MALTAAVRARVLAEISQLDGRIRADLAEDIPAVIYRDLTSTVGILAKTDALVIVPAGYPAAILDHVYVPAASPLRGVLKGQPEEVSVVAAGTTWKRVSYHPHNGGGAPAWNPSRHGFHTYIDELLSWLSVRR